jgi:hypothetical protein
MSPPRRENAGEEPIPAATNISGSHVPRQDSDVSIPSRFFASDNGSTHATQVSVHEQDQRESLRWYERKRLELAEFAIDQSTENLDLGRKSLKVSQQALRLSKISLGVGVGVGVAGLILSGLTKGKDSGANSSASAADLVSG